MPETSPFTQDFISQITAVVEKNISDEQFGVSELALEMNMSRSNLLRKIMKLTNLSVSQFIREIRLKRSMEMLKNSSLNVSEISHQVGFSSTSYFIKCFREHYGYPPGEIGKRKNGEVLSMHVPVSAETKTPRKLSLLVKIIAVVLIIAGAFLGYRLFLRSLSVEKSIAVLPFKNDSNDSTNVYLINGLMESTLNNLQKIKDLKVLSRTSAEIYRNTTKTIPQMARELNVNYFVEGSGQKIGDHILLNIQLIEASSDRHLWARQYKREAKDIFELQQDIAKSIAEEIKAVITPEEKARIEKRPTNDLVAYDYYLKGRDLFYKSNVFKSRLEEAVGYYKKAIARDDKFALAYADAAIVYYYLDYFKANRKYDAEISRYADKAFLYDPKLAESLIAKALVYTSKKEYASAIPYLEKALEYNPNSSLVIHFLTEFYNIHVPNTAKYLQYALIGVRLNINSRDSVGTSYTYLQLSNALVQTGFIDEALFYIDKSLAYNHKNPYSGYLKAFILLAKNKNLKQTREILIKELKNDTTRIDILQEIGKVCYHMKDYKSAFYYYQKFIAFKSTHQLNIYTNENLKIGIVLAKLGYKKESDEYLKSFKKYADKDLSIYKQLNLASYYFYMGEPVKALECMKMFSKEDNFTYWVLLYEMDPIVEPYKNLPQFRKEINTLEARFWKEHKEIRETLEEEGLLN